MFAVPNIELVSSTMAERSSIFEMIGPIIVGPSSSHTGGVVRIGRAAHHVLGGKPTRVNITWFNSFATTYEGHGSDRAVLAGLMDFKTDDLRIRNALDIAKEEGISYEFKTVGSASTYHPNTLLIECSNEAGQATILGESLGGAVVNIKEVDGFVANFSASLNTLIIWADDVKGSIAFIANILSHDDCNIATMSCSRKARHDMACLTIEVDSAPRQLTLDYITALSWVHKVVSFGPL